MAVGIPFNTKPVPIRQRKFHKQYQWVFELP